MKKLIQQKYIITATTLFVVVSFLASFLYIKQANSVLLSTYIDSVYTECKLYFRALNNMESKFNSITYQTLRSDSAIFSYVIDNDQEKIVSAQNILRQVALKNNLTELYVYHEKTQNFISYTAESDNTDVSGLRKVINDFSSDNPWYYLEQDNAPNKLFYISRDFSGFIFMYSVSIPAINNSIEQFADGSLDNFAIYYNSTYIADSSSLKNNVFQKSDLTSYDFKRLSNKSCYKKDGNLYICNTNYKYTIIVKQPVSAFSSYKLNAMQKFIYVLIAIFCSFIFALYLSYSLSKKRMNVYLNALKLHSNSDFFKLSSITKCAYDGIPVESEVLCDITENLTNNKSFVCVISQADFNNHNNSSYSISDSLKIMSAIITQTICDIYNCCSVICSNDTVITTIYSHDMISVDNLIELLSRIQEQFHTKTSITSSHLIGNIFYSSNDIYSSLANLNQISDFRFLYGYNSIVCQNTLNTDCNVAYPQEIVHDIIKTIIYSTPTQCLEYMDNFIYSVISHNSPRLAREWIASMVFSLIKETQYMYNNSSANGFSYLKQILDCSTIDECIIHIQNMFPEIALIRPQKKVLPGDIFKHQVAAIIANEYMNQDMNITYVAEKLNLVPAYFGQKFTKEYGTPFNAYLNNYRITCSMKLLSGTNDKIADIALQCGFSNAAYFTKAFRAHTNMTPSQYRSKRM